MTHYWLMDKDGTQYISNSGNPDDGSVSKDGFNWERPVDEDQLAQRQIIMVGILERAKLAQAELRGRMNRSLEGAVI